MRHGAKRNCRNWTLWFPTARRLNLSLWQAAVKIMLRALVALAKGVVDSQRNWGLSCVYLSCTTQECHREAREVPVAVVCFEPLAFTCLRTPMEIWPRGPGPHGGRPRSVADYADDTPASSRPHLHVRAKKGLVSALLPAFERVGVQLDSQDSEDDTRPRQTFGLQLGCARCNWDCEAPAANHDGGAVDQSPQFPPGFHWRAESRRNHLH